MSAVIVNDDIVHYEVLGRGPGVLFLHGWVGSWRYWIPSMQAVSARYRAYAMDLWGFGDSGKRRDRYDLALQTELLAGFLDRLGVPKVAIVGHALGGAVALRLAASHPELVARLMLVNTPLWGDVINPRIANFASVNDLLNLLVRTPDPAMTTESGKIDPDAIATAVAGLSTSDLRELAYGGDGPPCLVVQGDQDPATAAPQRTWLQDTLSGNGDGRLHYLEFEGAQHFPMFDDSSKFNRLLLDFLEADALQSLQLKEEWKRRMR